MNTEFLLHHAFLHAVIKLLISAALLAANAGCESPPQVGVQAAGPGSAGSSPIQVPVADADTPARAVAGDPEQKSAPPAQGHGQAFTAAIMAAPLPEGVPPRVLIDFYTADWCTPCKTAKSELATSRRFKIRQVLDYSGERDSGWCTALPAFVWFVDGKAHWHLGWQDGEAGLWQAVERTLPKGTYGKRPAHETDIAAAIAAEMRKRGIDAQTEYLLDDRTRVDILTPEAAIEVDWAEKWAEGIGQGLYYGLKTNRQACVLLLCDEEDDNRYVERAEYVAKRHGITVLTRSVK